MMQVGQLAVTGISDGTFVARPSYFGKHVSVAARPDVFDRFGAAWLPIGCFLIRAPGSLVLVDAGLGPEAKQLPDGMMLVGGQLLAGLHAAGVEPSDIDHVVCTHLHSDHCGWLYTPDMQTVFGSATIWVGTADLEAVLDGTLGTADHIRRGLGSHAAEPAVQRMTGTVEIAPGIVAQPSPGHTMGHYLVEVCSEGETLLLVGDAITCPIQLDEPTWHSYGDVDPALGLRNRDAIWERLRNEAFPAVGSHFPGLRAGRVDRVGGWVEERARADDRWG